MAGKTLTSSLIVRLVDQVSAPARKVSAALLGLNNSSKGGFGNRLNHAIADNEAALSRARARMVDVVAGAYLLKEALGAPIKAGLDFETMLEDIGQKADIPREKLAEVGAQIKQVARDTNQSTAEIGKAIDFLIGMGAKQDVAMTVTAPIGRAATAYRAATEDLAKATFAVVDNLKVPAQDAADALDAMAKAGKEGGFELKDMAAQFPSLTASAQFLGMTGVPAVADLAAALEVARKGAADGAVAANNMANFLQKINSKEAIKNFHKFGVDIPKELAKAAKDGTSPLEHMLEVIQKITKGDATKLNQLFGDKQVLEFIKPMLANMDEYRRIREEALKARGTVEADFQRRLQTAQASADRFNAAIQNLNTSIGSALLPLLTDLVGKLVPIIDKIGEWADKNPELARTIIATTAALVGFRIAVATLSFVGLLGKGGALSLLAAGFNSIAWAATAAKEAVALQSSLAALSGVNYSGFAKFVDGIKGIAMAVPGVAALGEAFAAIGAAMATISAPVWGALAVAVAAIAAAGFMIWKYWDRISAVFGGVAKRIGEELQPALDAAKPMFDWLGGVGKLIADGFTGAMKAIGDFFGTFFQQEVLTDEQKAQWGDAGYQWADAMIKSVKDGVMALVEWFRTLPGRIIEAIGKIDLSGILQWPPTPTELGEGGGERPRATTPSSNIEYRPSSGATSGARAAGGRVWAGSTYRINEKGVETFTPDRTGTIRPAGSGAGSNFHWSGDVIVQGASSPQETAREVARAVRDEVRSMLRGAHSDSMARA